MATITNHGLVFDSPEHKAAWEAWLSAQPFEIEARAEEKRRRERADAAALPGWQDFTARLILRDIPAGLRDQAIDAYEAGNAIRFLCLADNCFGMRIVYENRFYFLARGMYEEALVDAVTSTRTNNCWVTRGHWSDLFRIADRTRLRAAGTPLPHAGPFTLYRGTHGDRRYVRGVSWTLDLEQAKWFMGRGRGDASNAATKRRRRIGRCPS